MAIVHFTAHAEGTADYEVYVHGTALDTPGDVETYTNEPFVRSKFTGPEGARLRVEIKEGIRIVYREEAQIPLNMTSYASGDRYFRI